MHLRSFPGRAIHGDEGQRGLPEWTADDGRRPGQHRGGHRRLRRPARDLGLGSVCAGHDGTRTTRANYAHVGIGRQALRVVLVDVSVRDACGPTTRGRVLVEKKRTVRSCASVLVRNLADMESLIRITILVGHGVHEGISGSEGPLHGDFPVLFSFSTCVLSDSTASAWRIFVP